MPHLICSPGHSPQRRGPAPRQHRSADAKGSGGRGSKDGRQQEVDASSSRGEPLWRETGDGHGTTLVVTDAGLLAIGIKPVVVKAVIATREHAAKASAIRPPTQRAGTKQALLISLLQAPEGTTIEATSWKPHTLRGTMSGALSKKLGLIVTSAKEGDCARVYRINPGLF